MQDHDVETLRYPVGHFQWAGGSSPGERSAWLRTIAGTPAALTNAIADLTANQLDTPYRAGGWTVRQVVHHYADDHLNSYLRFKLALTEDAPLIKGYAENLWAELPDARVGPIQPSLQILAGVQERWVAAWKSLTAVEWERTFVHPVRGPVSLAHLAAIYAWHGVHHVTQILRLRERSGWNIL